MHKGTTPAVLILLTLALTPAIAAKLKGAATLKDSQPYGTIDKKHKNQGYDLTFDAEGKSYTCRTNQKNSMNATDFIVGGPITYQVDKQKATIRTPQNKKVDCTIVRVEITPAAAGSNASHPMQTLQ